jgi:hypothetical protein
VATLALSTGAVTAMAESQAPQVDPNAQSPAGVIYQIPLDSARRDAAPVLPTGRRDDGAGGSIGAGGGSGGNSGGSGGGSESASTGSSKDTQGASSDSSGNGPGTPQDPSSIHSENGFGSSSQVPGVSQAALRTGAGVAATQVAGSTTPTYLLIALIAIAAIGVGLLATWRSRKDDAEQPPAHR